MNIYDIFNILMLIVIAALVITGLFWADNHQDSKHYKLVVKICGWGLIFLLALFVVFALILL